MKLLTMAAALAITIPVAAQSITANAPIEDVEKANAANSIYNFKVEGLDGGTIDFAKFRERRS